MQIRRCRKKCGGWFGSGGSNWRSELNKDGKSVWLDGRWCCATLVSGLPGSKIWKKAKWQPWLACLFFTIRMVKLVRISLIVGWNIRVTSSLNDVTHIWTIFVTLSKDCHVVSLVSHDRFLQREWRHLYTHP